MLVLVGAGVPAGPRIWIAATEGGCYHGGRLLPVLAARRFGGTADFVERERSYRKFPQRVIEFEMFVRLLIIALLLYVAVRVAFWFYRQVKLYLSQQDARSVSRRADASEMVRDPVCGVYVAVPQALKEVTENGTFYFCSQECRRRFLEAHR